MTRINQIKRVTEPAAGIRSQLGSHGVEVGLVLWTPALRFEEHRDLGSSIRDAVGRLQDDPVVR